MADLNEKELMDQNQGESIDDVTMLLNYPYTRDNVDRYLSKDSATGSLLLIDIDNLGIINETLGYMFGDQIIRETSKVLRNVFRYSDIIGRVGGDLFAVFIRDVISEPMIFHKANEVWREIRQIYCGAEEHNISASIGVSRFPQDGIKFEELYQKAIIALEFAKENKKQWCQIYVNTMGNSPVKRGDKSQWVSLKEDNYDEFYTEIAGLTFRLMENATDTDRAIEILLQRIKDYFGFSIVGVQELAQDKLRTVRYIYEAIDSDVNSLKGKEETYSPEEWSNIKSMLEHSRYTFKINKSDPKWKDVVKNDSIESSLDGIRFFLGSKRALTGFVDFVYLDGNHVWVDKEVNFLKSFSRILSVYINRINTINEASMLALMMTERDSVTGLYSYEKFIDRMKECTALRTEPFMIVYTYSDLSNFKYINEAYGYETGDALLRKFSEYVTSEDNPRLICASRVHSDNIVVASRFPADTTPEEYTKVIDRVNAIITEKMRLYCHDNMIGVRSGIYCVMSNEGTVEAAVTKAGYACREAKERGENKCMLFSEDLMSVYKTQLKYMSELPSALQNRELKVYIQPKTLNDGHTVVGGEALIRWARVNSQMIFPNDFIPILEKSGAIVDLDFFVYKEVFSYIRNRLDNDLPVVPISMNVSRVHMRDKRFVKYVDELLKQYKLDTKYVEFELTESIYMDNMEPALQLLDWCKERNIKISMDDFGNGYSSLNMLDRVPIDIMKIDRIFLRNQKLEESNKIILESIIDMAKKLHITTVCEGVENEQQLAFLRSVGCDVIQGYYVAKPMTMDEFDHFMETHPVYQV